jgi:Family of unknown function (DUF6890)
LILYQSLLFPQAEVTEKNLAITQMFVSEFWENLKVAVNNGVVSAMSKEQ